MPSPASRSTTSRTVFAIAARTTRSRTNIADVREPNAFVDLTHSFARGPVKQTELFLNADRYLGRQGNVAGLHDDPRFRSLTAG
jgi:hypothetical protein